MSIESGGWFSRRAAHLLIFAGVFERHPELKLVLTEQPGEWWPAMADELDSVHRANTGWGGPLKKQVPLPPSEYLHRNVWIGASFLSRAEAHGAVRDGYADRVMWGSDYPHMEATWQRGPTAYSPLSLRFALAGLDEATVRAMVGGTAAHVYGLDLDALQATAAAHRGPDLRRAERAARRRCPPAPAPSPSAPTAPGTDRRRSPTRFRLRGPWGAGAMVSGPGGVAEWLRQGPAKPCTAVRFRPPPPESEGPFRSVGRGLPRHGPRSPPIRRPASRGPRSGGRRHRRRSPRTRGRP